MSADWPRVPLGEVLDKSNDWIALDPNTVYQEVTVRLWGKGVTVRREVPGAEIAASERICVRTNQFIVSRIDARNGAFGLIPDSLDGAVVSTDFPVFAVDGEKLDPAFLNWMSKTEVFVDLCKAASEGTTNRVRLKEDKFLATSIPVPPLPEQRRIVARVEAIASRIAEARLLQEASAAETIALSRVESRAIFESASPESIVPLETVCADIIDNLHSNPIYSESGVPCIRSPDVGWGKLMLETAYKTSEEEYRRRTVRGEPSPDDIVLVREGGGTGKAALIESGQRFSLGQRVMMLRPDKAKVLPKFLLYQLLSPVIYDDQILPFSTGSASPHLNIGALRKFPLQVPPLPHQRRIVAHLDALQAKADALRALQAETAAELDALLPAVLTKAFAGEL
jgi:type I restriction enzyme S subunit